MTVKLSGAVALVTGASSGIGAATAKRLAGEGAAVALVARRRERLETLVAQIEADGGKALAVAADISVRSHAETAVATVVSHFGRLDILVNNAGLMILGPIVGADVEDWQRMLAVNVRGLLYTTHAALPHLLKAGGEETRGIADIVNISSIAGRQAWPGFGVYNLTKFGMNGFTESLRQELASKRVRVGVLEPGAVETELESHNSDEIKASIFAPFNAQHRKLDPEDIADTIAHMVTRSPHAAIAEVWVMPSDQA